MHKQLQWIILISLIISNTFTGVHQWHKSTSREFFYYTILITILKKWTENFDRNIQCNRTTHFYRNYFLADSECPQTEDPQTNSWLVNLIRKLISKKFRPITNLFGGPPFGDTQNPRENNFYKNGLSCYGV